MDAIDLAGPWIAGAPTRSERVTALALRMGQVVVAADASDGRRLTDALGRAWAQHRIRLLQHADAQSRALELLEEVQTVRIALAAGVGACDVRCVSTATS